MRRREAEAALLASDARLALDALWPTVVRSVSRGEQLYDDRGLDLRLLDAETGIVQWRELPQVIEAMPGRRTSH